MVAVLWVTSAGWRAGGIGSGASGAVLAVPGGPRITLDRPGYTSVSPRLAVAYRGDQAVGMAYAIASGVPPLAVGWSDGQVVRPPWPGGPVAGPGGGRPPEGGVI